MPRKTKRKTRRKNKIWRKAMKKGRVAKRWMKRHIIVYEIIISLLIVGGVYFGIMGSICLALQTDSPYRAVISGSMYHGGESWRDYFEDKDLRYNTLLQAGQLNPADDVETFDTSQFPLQGGFERGDLLIVKGVNPLTDVAIGDAVIVDLGPYAIPLVHRVYNIRYDEESMEIIFTTKGDNNQPPNLPIGSSDINVKPEQILGKVVFVIPKLGNLSLWWRGQ